MPYATDQGSYAFPQKLLSLTTDQQENHTKRGSNFGIPIRSLLFSFTILVKVAYLIVSRLLKQLNP